MRSFKPRTGLRRPATAAVEFAVVAPFIAFLLVIGVDFARVYRHSQV